MKKKLLIISLSLILAYYGSFLVFGKNALVHKIKEDSHSSYNTYRWTTHVNLVSNMDLTPEQLTAFNSLWPSSNLDLNFKQVESFEQIPDFNKENTYHYILIINTKVLPWISIEECEKIEEYAAFWQIDYVWCFFTWIKVGEESLGMS
ncbi:hypothetical protein JMN32_10130 [Fulvivirga sp. 29W222]|uniref:Uncharacterized protein n=1 Tax=Fulvivirga marina TaxID=2494733 RepID=A0A937FYE9_9BACT|nr:hypothetical protein [Fulvivirga marina]MBL6446670.1 hypothetical protein [Fulvivirga marina]